MGRGTFSFERRRFQEWIDSGTIRVTRRGRTYALAKPRVALALVNPADYASAFPGCSILRGDTNGNGVVDGQDTQAFLSLLP